MRRSQQKSYEMDMLSGPILGKIVRFSLPLMLTGILQLLYNAADIIVVGQYSGKEALAAVGSAGALINLLINLFMGFSVGTSVVIAQQKGAGDLAGVQRTVHTSIALGLASGIGVGIFGLATAKTLLEAMGSPADVIDASTLYIRIYFIGMPANMLYTFGSAVLRAVGDTKRPLYFLTLSGLVNVALNLMFVIGFQMSVAGVALATILSQVVSAVLVMRCLMHATDSTRFVPQKMRMHRDSLREITRIGLPAGLQGSLFSISNVLIQSSVNSFGSVVMAGCAASSNLEGFVYAAMNGVYQACLTFVGQNVGARLYRRVRRILWVCLAAVTVVGLTIGGLFYVFAAPLLSIYNSDPEVIRQGMIKLHIICATHFMCGIMNVLTGHLRGLGYSVMPMITSLTGVCGFRIFWIFTIFAEHRTLQTLIYSYPITWFLTSAFLAAAYAVIQRRFPRRDEGPAESAATVT